MKRNNFKRIAIMALSVLMLLIVFAPVASAEQIKQFDFKTASYGKNHAVFYVNTYNSSKTPVQYASYKGYMHKNGASSTVYMQGYYEIKIWGRNSTSESWKYMSKTNITAKSVSTYGSFNVKGYTQYKIQVYAWSTANFGQTVSKEYGTKSYWDTLLLPTISFFKSDTYGKNIKSIAKL